MGVRKRKKKIIENLTIEKMAAEGKCLGHHDDKVIFVTNTAPGDVVDVRLTKIRGAYAEGTPINFHTYSDQRIEPFCKHFELCGGCKWQHIPYEMQLDTKHQQVQDALTRIGGLEIPEPEAILGSKKTQYYRNKMEYTFSATRWLSEEDIKSGEEFDRRGLGFHIPGRFDKVVEVTECFLQDDVANKIRNFTREFCLANEMAYFNFNDHSGLMRNLIIRNTSIGELMVIVQFTGLNDPASDRLMEALKNEFPQITSLNYIRNAKKNETFFDQEVVCFSGKDHIIEEMEGIRFKIGPKSFYQTNSEQAYELYKVIRDYAQLSGNETVYDLYTGTGTIANFLAKDAKEVIGIEHVEAAIEDAKINSSENNISNTKFYAGDMKDFFNDAFLVNHTRPEVIITDPPRAGMHEDVVHMLRKVAAPKIVYVSCNPATQARDLKLLADMYEVKKVRPVDMFPHTHHVENVVLLKRR